MDFELGQHIKELKKNPETDSSYIDKLEETQTYKNSTTHRRAEFEALNLEKVNYVKSCLFIIYCLLVLLFVYIMFKNKILNTRQKVFFIGTMLVYPYIATPLLIYLYETAMYIVALSTGEIYKKTDIQ
jgi:hypothetical protein